MLVESAPGGLPALIDPLGLPSDLAPSGVVYGVLMNDPASLERLGAAVQDRPYQGAPRAPVLYLKPRNTHAPAGSRTLVDPDVPGFEIGAALALVIGRTACRVRPGQALAHLAGYLLVADLSVPHDDWYRPSVRLRARDHSLLVSPALWPVGAFDPDALRFSVAIDGQVLQRASTEGRLRPVARLLADVTEFMTLRRGDLLLTGIAEGAPFALAGQRFTIEALGAGRLEGELRAAEPRR